ncbi:MAG: hypothetical protein Sapg2KO_06770 [Saprospiraceae bacterium]
MKRIPSSLSILFLCALLFTACSGGSETAENEAEETISSSDNLTINDKEIEINSPEDLTNAISQAMKQLNNGEEVDAVDFRELKALLPERLAGMKRTNIEGEKTGMGGFKYSVAKATYEKGDSRMEVSILDGAGFAGVVSGMAAWSLIEVDRETDTGYERTTTIDGYKAFESFDSEQEEGQLSVVVEDRFIVNIEGDRIPTDKDLKRALDGLNLSKLKKAI